MPGECRVSRTPANTSTGKYWQSAAKQDAEASRTRTARSTKNGHAMVPNGIPLSKIHHAAFDAHLIGIDPDYGLHVSLERLEQNDGPMSEG
jgi:predicted restriction endonuclease